MESIALRYVGIERLPTRISRFDVEGFFALSRDDVQAIKANFRDDRQVGAALQLTFLRAAGRALDRLAVVPRPLLLYIGEALRVPAPTIASLQSIYRRTRTLYAHQSWAREYVGLSDFDDQARDDLRKILSVAASEAASVDELVRAAACWLYERRYLIPAERTLRDFAREAFAVIEQQALTAIEALVPRRQWTQLIGRLYAKRHGRAAATTVEWLKTAPARHSPSTLKDVLQKIALLREWKVDAWTLGTALSLARQRAYARSFASRPPSVSRRQLETSLIVEAICFLRITLLELTDQALQLASRRTVDLVRRAQTRAQVESQQSADALRGCLAQVARIVDDDSQSPEQRLQAIRQLLVAHSEIVSLSKAAQTRTALADDTGAVRALLWQLNDLPFEGRERDHGLRQWRALQSLYAAKVSELGPGCDSPVRSAWRNLVNDPDRKKAMRAFEASTLMSLRTSLRRGSVWVAHSYSFRDRDELLIPPSLWAEQRAQHIGLLHQSGEPRKFLDRLRDLVEAGLAALADAVDKGAVSIEAGQIRIPALTALDIDRAPLRTRDALFQAIGEAQLPEILVEVDAATGFSQRLLARQATDELELISLYAALLAHGTEVDAKSVAAMTPGIDPAHVSSSMRLLELPGRLRRANEAVLDFQSRHSIAQLWGDGATASADMMSLDASRHLWNARVDPRRRTYAAGVYTHVLNRHGIVYDMPVVLNERQTGAAIEGVERYNAEVNEDRARLTLLAVDTHGYTHMGMAVAKLLGLDLCPRLKSLAERKLYVPRNRNDFPDVLEPIVAREVSFKPIEQGWDDLLRLVASIKSGRVSAVVALQRLGSAAQGDLLHRAGDSLGKLLRTVFLCDYFSQSDFRREIHTLLNRGESVHQLQRAIYYGRIAPERGRRSDEMIAISGAHALLTNVVLAWNIAKMEQAVRSCRARGIRVEDDWLRRMGPAHFSHINFRGVLRFPLQNYRDALIAPRAKGVHKYAA